MKRIVLGVFSVAAFLPAWMVFGQGVAGVPSPTVEEIGDRLYRIGNIQLDLARRMATVPGVVNDVSVLEFLANTRGGFKAYESAIELDTDAYAFNLSMLLMGLDNTNAVLPQKHFDPNPPEGDPVRVWVEWSKDGVDHRVPGERLLYNQEYDRVFPETHWVYTGSVFLPDGRYLAQSDGVLIGFVHTPAPVIENPMPDGVGNYGAWVPNPHIGLDPGTAVQLIVEVVQGGGE